MLRTIVVIIVLAIICAAPVQADPFVPLMGVELFRQFHLASRVESSSQVAIIRQKSELTCGPAAIASLLTFYFRDPTSEDAVAKLAGTYDQARTTLLALRDACRAKGYEAVGYRMTFPQLEATLVDTGLPILAHYREPLMHFVLVVAVQEGHVLVSDPAAGSITLDVDDFVRRWSGAVLVVTQSGSADRTRVQRRRASFVQRFHSLRETNRVVGTPRL